MGYKPTSVQDTLCNCFGLEGGQVVDCFNDKKEEGVRERKSGIKKLTCLSPLIRECSNVCVKVNYHCGTVPKIHGDT